MKTGFRASMVLIIACLFATFCLGQTAPTAPKVPSDQKLAVRDAQHALDKVVQEQDAITNQYLLLQQKMQSEAERLQKQHADAQAAVDKAVSAIDCGKDFKFDQESTSCIATPAPAAPTNANSQPKSSTPSPGAAVPPKIQEAKK